MDSDSDSDFELVVDLDRSNFDNFIRNYDLVVVRFHFCEQDWEECYRMYEKVAKLFINDDSPVVLARNAKFKSEKVLRAKYGIRSYPTVMIFKDGGRKIEEYRGPQVDARGMFECLKRVTSPFPAQIYSTEDAVNLIGHEKIVIVGVFPEFCGIEYDNFIKASEKLKWDYDVFLTSDAKQLLTDESSSVVSGPIVRVFKPLSIYEERFVDTTIFNVDALLKFVQEASTPVVTVYKQDPQLDAKFFYSKNVYAKAMLFINRECHRAFESKYHEVAKENKGHEISFMIGDFVDSQVVVWSYEIHKSTTPLIVIRDPNGDTYVKADLEKPDDIVTWLEDYKAGKVAEYGTPIPLSREMNEAVMVVVAETFEKMVMDTEKNVFLLLGPWCHWCDSCKNLAQVFYDLVTHFDKENVVDVVIAKLYKNARDIRKKYLHDYYLNVEDYPNLCFKKAGEKKLYLYQGIVATDNIIQFIYNNGIYNNKPANVKFATKLNGEEEKIVILDHMTVSEASYIYRKSTEEEKVFYASSQLSPVENYISEDDFQRMVMDPRLNALLCMLGSECKKSIPLRTSTLKRVANHFKEKENEKDTELVIAWMRAVDYFTLSMGKVLVGVMHHYKTLSQKDEPTIYFKTASGKLMVYDYDDITKENLITFIHEHKEDRINLESKTSKTFLRLSSIPHDSHLKSYKSYTR
ncbi:hypothetical protein ACFE04_029841 [Oxalis oulophora]